MSVAMRMMVASLRHFFAMTMILSVGTSLTGQKQDVDR